MGVVDTDVLGVVVLVVRNHLEAILAFLLQALHVQHVIVGEQVDTVAGELPDSDVDEQGVAILDRGSHRLAPAGDHLEVEVLFEGDAQVA